MDILKKKLKTFFFKECCTSKNQISDEYRSDLVTLSFIGRYAIDRENDEYRLDLVGRYSIGRENSKTLMALFRTGP